MLICDGCCGDEAITSQVALSSLDFALYQLAMTKASHRFIAMIISLPQPAKIARLHHVSSLNYNLSILIEV